MALIIASVIVAALLPLLAKAPMGYAQSKMAGGYDNHNPREQQKALTGLGLRALAAHNNAFEAFPPFAAGVLLALWGEAPLFTMQILCGVHIVARVGHALFYFADVPPLRSLCWAIGMVASIWLMCLAF
ncbi:MAPEG family protein [Halioxenophilus sp. WMMB6]|uniref:MAPEG family protein n=1 Tax=Halioxenophilus sp. WMMB6 TaxID=3073815 RepID=UPI00295F0F7A|nr:MAPEG family protein [Halioxenophilus sp. WMMB6]